MSGNNVLLDTNAVGIYLDDKQFFKKYLKPDVIISNSVISQLEFLSNPELTPKNRAVFDEFIAFIDVWPLTRENKELVSQVISIRKKYKLKLPDAIIAATTMVKDTTLFSADTAFSKIFNIKFQLIKA